MGRYAYASPVVEARPGHWSDQLEPGSPWAEVTLQVSASRSAWGEQGIAPEDMQRMLNALVDKIKVEAMMLGVEVEASVTAETQAPNI